jgi:hypothetical protein
MTTVCSVDVAGAGSPNKSVRSVCAFASDENTAPANSKAVKLLVAILLVMIYSCKLIERNYLASTIHWLPVSLRSHHAPATLKQSLLARVGFQRIAA